MSSIFSKIIAGQIPSYKIGETEDCYAFLDINPLRVGHTLVVPKKEVNRLFDLDDDLYMELFEYCKKIAAAIQKACPCDRVGLAVIGLEVPHAHVHLIPINCMNDMNFAQPKLQLSEEEFEHTLKNIRKFL